MFGGVKPLDIDVLESETMGLNDELNVLDSGILELDSERIGVANVKDEILKNTDGFNDNSDIMADGDDTQVQFNIYF